MNAMLRKTAGKVAKTLVDTVVKEVEGPGAIYLLAPPKRGKNASYWRGFVNEMVEKLVNSVNVKPNEKLEQWLFDYLGDVATVELQKVYCAVFAREFFNSGKRPMNLTNLFYNFAHDMEHLTDALELAMEKLRIEFVAAESKPQVRRKSVGGRRAASQASA